MFGRRLKQAVEALQAENAQLKERLAALERPSEGIPGVSAGQKDWFVTVGGEKVEVRALDGAAFFEAFEGLPEFVFAYATTKTLKGQLGKEDLELILERAKRWIKACAIEAEGVKLERLTLPEAEHAIAHIAELNGITDQLRKFFLERTEAVARARPAGQALRRAPQQPARPEPN